MWKETYIHLSYIGKYEYWKWGRHKQKSFEFLKSYISKWENWWRVNWPPPTKCNPPSQDNNPWNEKYFDLPQKPKIQKFQLPLNLVEVGAYYGKCNSVLHTYLDYTIPITPSITPSITPTMTPTISKLVWTFQVLLELF